MGERPTLDPAEAAKSLSDSYGRLVADSRAPRSVRLNEKQRVSFSDYAALEGRMLLELERGANVFSVLNAPRTLPSLRKAKWRDIAHLFRAELDDSSYGHALAWFGDSLLELVTKKSVPNRVRPWSPGFEHAEKRTKKPASFKSILADWVADELWSLRWTRRRTFDLARREMAARIVIATEAARRMRRQGAREDRAAAEAVMLLELVGESDLWDDVVAGV